MREYIVDLQSFMLEVPEGATEAEIIDLAIDAIKAKADEGEIYLDGIPEEF